MGQVFIQYSDESKKTIIAEFGCAQDPDAYPNQGEIADDDALYQAFLSPPLPEVITNPLDKLKAFLADNPDVVAILE